MPQIDNVLNIDEREDPRNEYDEWFIKFTLILYLIPWRPVTNFITSEYIHLHMSTLADTKRLACLQPDKSYRKQVDAKAFEAW
jgi:hypothetical protein